MSILMTAMALAAAPAPTAAQPAPSVAPAAHVHHAQPPAKPEAKGGCCCDKMAEGGKMECCAKHGKGHSVEHSGHTAH
jgi:hypothetical protein